MDNRRGHLRAGDHLDRLIGRNLRRHRRRVGISQASLGEAMGCTHQQVARYEQGTNRLSLTRAWHAARALGIKVSELLDPDEQERTTA
jgi:transcriptional regulator with XRE-family HTH domain